MMPSVYVLKLNSMIRELLKGADLKLYVCDATDAMSQSALVELINGADASALERVVIVMNKVDSPESMQLCVHPSISKKALAIYNISCLTGEGFDGLEAGIKAQVLSALGVDPSPDAPSSSHAVRAIQDRVSGITRQRHRFHVEQCILHIHRFLQGTRAAVFPGAEDIDGFELPMDARAEELR
jgi:tRNA U34 5-carboxymethylaminomethyl modifying GTPase MnmE/TrmE